MRVLASGRWAVGSASQIPALPSDVWKGYAFPESVSLSVGAPPQDATPSEREAAKKAPSPSAHQVSEPGGNLRVGLSVARLLKLRRSSAQDELAWMNCNYRGFNLNAFLFVGEDLNSGSRFDYRLLALL